MGRRAFCLNMKCVFVYESVYVQLANRNDFVAMVICLLECSGGKNNKPSGSLYRRSVLTVRSRPTLDDFNVHVEYRL